ncbi:MAG: YbaN family protein [Prevotellaceae bacterium]|nr:YbaN family protein [Prevotellaceae bacterium]
MRFLLIFLGTISLILGVLGIFLPLLPTTPFLLLTAALYFRGSQRCYDWLMNHRVLGVYIRNFRENRAIPRRVKVISISLLWLTMLTSAWFFVPYWWVRILMIVIAGLVTRHILSFKSL